MVYGNAHIKAPKRALAGVLAMVISMSSYGIAYAVDSESADLAPIPLLSLVSSIALAAQDLAAQDTVEAQRDGSSVASISQQNEPGNSGFLYFRDDKGPDTTTGGSNNNISFSSRISTFTPRGATLPGGIATQAFPDEIGILNSFTPRQASAEFGVRFGSAITEQEKRKSFQISLSSSLSVQPVNLTGLFTQTLPGSEYDRHSVNLGLNIGYSGFRLGAFLVREAGGLAPGFEGVDVGLSYQSSNWSTSLTVGEYNRRYNSLFTSSLGTEDSFYALQFGANYYLYPALRLSGGVRFFEYGPRFGLTPDLSTRSQLFYLGTNLNF